jgi:hypothetical protein
MAPHHTMYNPPERCKNCARTITAEQPTNGRYHGTVTRVVIEHDHYGCDSGCCGHRIYGYNEHGNITCSDFSFNHPDSEATDDIHKYVAEQVRELFGRYIPVDLANSDIRHD